MLKLFKNIIFPTMGLFFILQTGHLIDCKTKEQVKMKGGGGNSDIKLGKAAKKADVIFAQVVEKSKTVLDTGNCSEVLAYAEKFMTIVQSETYANQPLTLSMPHRDMMKSMSAAEVRRLKGMEAKWFGETYIQLCWKLWECKHDYFVLSYDWYWASRYYGSSASGFFEDFFPGFLKKADASVIERARAAGKEGMNDTVFWENMMDIFETSGKYEKLDSLLGWLENSTSVKHAFVWPVLRYVGNSGNREAVDVVIKFLGHSDYNTRIYAIDTLIKLNSKKAIPKLKMVAQNDPYYYTQNYQKHYSVRKKAQMAVQKLTLSGSD